jgi:coproporphyrinogen III oxidase-like Fe-S oxidoreductase
LKTLQSTLGFASNAEITLEMDPGTFDDDKLVKLRDAGVTRLSLGVQSFDSEILRKCGRAHTVDDIANSLRLVMASDFKDNFSIDLISSLPGLSDETWQNTLDSAASCGCSHISVYDLQIEDKTAFGRWYTPGIFPLPTDEQSASMYCSAAASLIAKGFEHYEVSNYAKAGKRSQHNQRYWKCLPTWGFGMGAASFIENNRFTRPDRMAEYSNWVTQLELEGFGLTTALTDNLIVDNESNNTEGDSETDDLLLSDGIYSPPGAPDILEVVMLALRTSDGLDLAALRSVYGSLSVEKIYGAVKPFVERGLVVITNEKVEGTDFRESTISLTDPEGFLLSNDIISSVFVELTC